MKRRHQPQLGALHVSDINVGVEIITTLKSAMIGSYRPFKLHIPEINGHLNGRTHFGS